MSQRLRLEYRSPQELAANPQNWRVHPETQLQALDDIMNEVGWAGAVLYNENTHRLIDGHMRRNRAIAEREELIPVIIGSWTEEQERKLLATIDPLGDLARTDSGKLATLLKDTEIPSESLSKFLGGLIETTPDRKEAVGSLFNQFFIPPFSILDSRQGYWVDRKRQWLNLGIRSELGRGNNLQYPDSVQPSSVYNHKNKVEQELGRILPWAEFYKLYPDAYKMSGTSIFDPVLAEANYRWFCPPGGTILDPFAGGSVRGIVASVLGFNYIGIDVRPEQVENNQRQAAEILPAECHQPTWIADDSRNIPNIIKEPVDFVFTCPPYGNTERYSDDPKDISTMSTEDFDIVYREIILAALDKLKPNRFAALVVGDFRDKNDGFHGFPAYNTRVMVEAGLIHYNAAVYITPTASVPITCGRAFTASRKLAKTHQRLEVYGNKLEQNHIDVATYVKGDARAATKDVGTDNMVSIMAEEAAFLAGLTAETAEAPVLAPVGLEPPPPAAEPPPAVKTKERKKFGTFVRPKSG